MERGEEYADGNRRLGLDEMQAPQAGNLISGLSALRGLLDMSKADGAASRIARATVVTITTKLSRSQQNVGGAR
jgi:hypothetical protein